MAIFSSRCDPKKKSNANYTPLYLLFCLYECVIFLHSHRAPAALVAVLLRRGRNPFFPPFSCASYDIGKYFQVAYSLRFRNNGKTLFPSEGQPYSVTRRPKLQVCRTRNYSVHRRGWNVGAISGRHVQGRVVPTRRWKHSLRARGIGRLSVVFEVLPPAIIPLPMHSKSWLPGR